jgi:AcrR family transcriptional regulator
MIELLRQVQIKVNERLYLKDPESTELGRSVLTHSIQLLHEIGFEQFTFKKLAEKMQSTESTLYRYFENKHKLLLYLMNWYWCWLEYKLVFATANIEQAETRLRIAIKTVLEPQEKLEVFAHINMQELNRVVIAESPKTYLTREVDIENKEGFFVVYKRLCKRLVSIILELSPEYAYADTLVSTIIEGAHLQYYFREHLPSLTNFRQSDDEIAVYYTDLILAAVNQH